MNIRKIQALRAKRGFTLVELIVVIAIIAILAAILIPLLVSHVRSSRCTNEIADAKSGHNVASSHIAARLAQNALPAEILTYTQSNIPGVPQGVAITVSENADGNFVVNSSTREHEYNSDSGVKPCDWERCPGKTGS
jgi:prepilin-type N-terminal cleavage/methylation domain-containing protein